MKIDISVPELVNVFKEIQRPDQLFAMIRSDLKEKTEQYLSKLMEAELTAFLGRKPYERQQGAVNHRNGSYDRQYALKAVGNLNVKVPRDRQGQFKTHVIPRSKRYEKAIAEDLSLMFLTGVSTRSLSMISKKLTGRKISPSEISKINKEMVAAVGQWRERDLSKECIKYMFIDGVNFDMRIHRSIEKVPVLVAIGVAANGCKKVLSFQSGDKESAGTWREFFKDLKTRGLDNKSVTLGIMDGLPGLEKVFKEEFPSAKVQRCQVHVASNVLAKVPKKLKKDVADDMRSIYYASSKKKAMDFFNIFKNKWEKDLPSAVKCLGNSIDSCLTFMDFPKEEWISLRTSNVIERLNKEFKRRTKPMEIVAGKNTCSFTILYGGP